MISRETAQMAVVEISEWAEQHNVSGEDVADLLNRLRAVPGNKSWEQSLEAVALMVHEMAVTD
jgi:hypothetical protein